jgi:predicted metalloprotease with PDZ domain
LDASRTLRSGSSDSDKFRTRYNLAHHIAHSWIPKRSCGEGYFPFTWEHAPIIDTIWLSEGFVQYAAVEMITDGLPVSKRQEIRDPLIDSRFRKSLVDAPEFINRLSLTELSRAASTKYSEDFRYGRNVFSRGAMMALELDERIRKVSDGKRRFRDVMRFLMVWSERERRPFKVREIPSIIADATGVDVRSVIDRWMKPPIE